MDISSSATLRSDSLTILFMNKFVCKFLFVFQEKERWNLNLYKDHSEVIEIPFQNDKKRSIQQYETRLFRGIPCVGSVLF